MYIEKGEIVLKRFNKTKAGVKIERNFVIESIENSEKSVEKNICDLVYLNCISAKARWSCIAVIAFNSIGPFMGQTFNEVYTTPIFDKLQYDGFGYQLTFYSGFAVVFGGLMAVLLIEKMGRQTMIVWGF